MKVGGVANRAVTSIGADQIGDRLEYAVSYDEDSHLSDVPIFDSVQLRTLESSGVVSVAHFLAFVTSEIPRQWVEVGLNQAVVENLQAEIWLLTCVPALRPTDAHVLVACGITEPQHLETSDAQALFERIERYLNAHENGQTNFERISLSRISDWHRGLSRTRNRWQSGRRSSRRSASNGNFSMDRNSRRTQLAGDSSTSGLQIRKFTPDSDRDGRDGSANDFGRSRRNDSGRNDSRRNGERRSRRSSHTNENRQPRVAAFDMPNSNGELERQSDYRNYDGNRERSSRDRSGGSSSRRRDGRSEREPRDMRSPRIQTPTPERVRRAIPALAPAEARVESEVKPAAKRTTKQTSKKDKFYLDLDDHIEAAPSIGPKTAERFEKIGVKTIEQFLKQTLNRWPPN